MTRYWVVMSGSADGDNIIELVEDLSLVGIGWPDVGDLHGLSYSAIRAKVEEAYPDDSAGLSSTMLSYFTNQMNVGDIVLTRKPDPYGRLVLIGRIAGEYQFDETPDHYLLSHTRGVEWLRTDITFDQYRETFESNGKHPAYGAQAVWNADEHANEIEQLLALGPSGGDLPSNGEDIQLKFGLERELQSALAANIDQLESGLEIAEDGLEKTVTAGRIDIAATDNQGHIVVIELKAGTAQPESITQLLSYMGTVDNPENKPIRGILVAHDFAAKVRYAAKAIPNVVLRSYSFKFSFKAEEEDE